MKSTTIDAVLPGERFHELSADELPAVAGGSFNLVFRIPFTKWEISLHVDDSFDLCLTEVNANVTGPNCVSVPLK